MSAQLFVRVVALIPLLAAILLWADHHLGIKAGNLGWLSLPIAAITGAIAFIDKLLEKDEQESLLRTLRDLVRRLLSVQVLVLAYLVALVVGLTYSSVQVIRSSADGTPILTAVDNGQNQTPRTGDDGGDLVRFIVRTTPFGRPFRLDLSGYVPDTLDVYPLVGRTVRPGKDLRRSPSVLLRLPIAAQRALKEGGQLIIWRFNGPQRSELARTGEPCAAFLLGRAQPLPASSLNDWRLELLASGAEEKEIPRIIVGWKRPKPLEPKSVLEPDMKLFAEVRTVADKTVASGEVTLGADSLVDIGLEEVP